MLIGVTRGSPAGDDETSLKVEFPFILLISYIVFQLVSTVIYKQ